MNDLISKTIEDGALIELDDDEQMLVLQDEIKKEREGALDAGRLWTPWRRRRYGERAHWCCDDYHQKNHKQKEMGVYISYATNFRTLVLLCERCFRKNSGEAFRHPTLPSDFVPVASHMRFHRF